MKIDVYDSYAQSKQGHIMHFDVFVESGTSKDKAYAYGCVWLAEIGEDVNGLDQSKCTFCHTEQANINVQTTIKDEGYYILQMEGCPEPIV